MSFLAANNLIQVKDTNGEVSFSTDYNMPCISSVHEFHVTQMFDQESSIDYEFDLGHLPDAPDFVLTRAECKPRGRRYTAGAKVDGVYVPGVEYWVDGEGGLDKWADTIKGIGFVQREAPWFNCAKGGKMFFQGSAILEIGSNCAVGGVGQYAVRSIHVFNEPDYNNMLICRLQQSVTFGEYINLAFAQVEWDISLKIWCGKFRH